MMLAATSEFADACAALTPCIVPLVPSSEDKKKNSEMASMKSELFLQKMMLRDVANYGAAARRIDMYAQVKRFIRIGGYHATNATLKILEITECLGLRRNTDEKVFSNAEFPGGFILGLRGTAGPGFDWVASSHTPGDDKEYLRDEFKLWARHRRHWLQGERPNAMPEGYPEVDGDLTSLEVVRALAAAVHARYPGGATLYTGDGSCVGYEDVEERMTPLLLGEVLCGLLSLAVGGNFVVKLFTLFERTTQSLLASVASVFDETFLIKPLTSRAANSEVYLVGKGFRGLSSPLEKQMCDCLGTGEEFIVDTSAYDSALTEAARRLFAQQMYTLKMLIKIDDEAATNAKLVEHTLAKVALKLSRDWLSAHPRIARFQVRQHKTVRDAPGTVGKTP